MKRQISFGEYRAIDLALLTTILAVSQYLVYAAASSWFPDQLYIVSPVAGMTALVMMRWGVWGALPAAFGGVFYAFLAGGNLGQTLIYCAGNLAALGALVFFRIWGKERVRNESFLAVVYAVAVQLLMQLGRAAVAAVLGYEAAACLGFITTDILSILFTVFIVWIIRRIEGLFEDQKNYLLRLQKEQQVERGEQL